jgi:hypothetical protein
MRKANFGLVTQPLMTWRVQIVSNGNPVDLPVGSGSRSVELYAF